MAAVKIWETAAWAALRAHVEEIKTTHLRDLLKDAERCKYLTTEFSGILLDYSRQRVTQETMGLLLSLAEAAGVQQKIRAMAEGERLNTTEGRAVMHMALRAPKTASFKVDGADVVPAVHGVLDRIHDFTDRVRSGVWKGVTGKPLKDVVSIGSKQ